MAVECFENKRLLHIRKAKNLRKTFDFVEKQRTNRKKNAFGVKTIWKNVQPESVVGDANKLFPIFRNKNVQFNGSGRAIRTALTYIIMIANAYKIRVFSVESDES